MTLQDNGSDTLALNANGTFRFAQTVATNGSYTVTVLTQPVGQSCAVESGAGSIAADVIAVDTVNVTCVTVATIGGTVTGLGPGTSVTLSNGDVLLPIALNGAFAFPGLVPAGTPYNVTIATQPAGEVCTLSNATGTVVQGQPTQVAVTCL